MSPNSRKYNNTEGQSSADDIILFPERPQHDQEEDDDDDNDDIVENDDGRGACYNPRCFSHQEKEEEYHSSSSSSSTSSCSHKKEETIVQHLPPLLSSWDDHKKEQQSRQQQQQNLPLPNHQYHQHVPYEENNDDDAAIGPTHRRTNDVVGTINNPITLLSNALLDDHNDTVNPHNDDVDDEPDLPPSKVASHHDAAVEGNDDNINHVDDDDHHDDDDDDGSSGDGYCYDSDDDYYYAGQNPPPAQLLVAAASSSEHKRRWIIQQQQQRSMSVRSLSTAFSLNVSTGGSTGTVSSLEHEDDPFPDDDDGDDDHVIVDVEDDVVLVDKNCIAIKNGCPGDGERQDVLRHPYNNTEVTVADTQRTHVEIEWEGGAGEDPSYTEYEEIDETNNNDDDYDADLQRTITRMHQSMVISGNGAATRRLRGQIPIQSSSLRVLDRTTDDVDGEDVEEILVHVDWNHSFHYFHDDGGDKVPTNLSAAKQFLSSVADVPSNSNSNKGRSKPTLTMESTDTSTMKDDRCLHRPALAPPPPTQNRMSPRFYGRRFHSSRDSMTSSEYTEVLVSSDGSFDFDDECTYGTDEGKVIAFSQHPESPYRASPRTSFRRIVSAGRNVGSHEEIIEEQFDEDDDEEEEYHEEVIDDEDGDTIEEVIVEEDESDQHY